MFSQILVLLDGSSRAEQAVVIARRLDETTHASLTFLTVIDPESEEIRLSVPSCATLSERITHEESSRANYMAQLIRHWHLPLTQADCLIREGALIPTILSVLQEQHIDLLILCSHDPREQRAHNTDSVTQQLIAQSDVPMLALKEGSIIPHTAYPDSRRPLHSVEIVVGLDGTEHAERAILPAAYLVSAIAHPARGTVHLVHIHRLPSTQIAWTQKHIRETEEYQQSLSYVRQQAEKLQKGEGDHLHIAVLYSVFPATETPAGLIQFAEKRHGQITGASDIVAMYTHQRPQRGNLFQPYVTDAVLADTELPLFVI